VERKQLENLMDKFIRKEITEEELNELEIASLLDAGAESEIKLINDIAKGIEIVGNDDLKLVLDKIHYQNITNDSPTVSRPKSKTRWIWISLALILTSLLFFILNNKFLKSSKNVDNYAAYFEPYIPTLNTRGIDSQKRISDFGNAYSQKRYARALLIVEPILEQSNNELVLIAAICATKTQDYSKANQLFDKIINSNDYYFLDHAKWYKALCYLRQDLKDEARILLNELAGDENADHHGQAKDLLEDI